MKYYLLLMICSFALAPALQAAEATAAARPNIVLILTDDQGFGDLGVHGNPKIQTPNIDKFAAQSLEMTNFYVSPVCAPTRASLLTGRYNYRTGAIDTFMGRAMMYPDEVTLAEMLKGAGYHTGIFGKWHLGDNYPLRAMDQGFEEMLVLKGGGIGQNSDPPGGDHYMNPTLYHNGEAMKAKGYCSNVYTDAAMKFIESNKEKSFFVYLPFNCPHTPLETPPGYEEKYKNADLGPNAFPKSGQPWGDLFSAAVTAKIYAMETNIDDNVGRLLAKLDALKLAENTIVIFMTDNGPQQDRYRAGLRGLKGSTFEGGIHVPFFIRWPGKIGAGKKNDRIAAHIDLAPTLLATCEVEPPASVKFDGMNLLPIFRGEKVEWVDRTLYFQWHRGDVPDLYRAFAARSQRWKLVQPLGAGDGKAPTNAPLMLFDMPADPYEMKDLAGEHPEIVAKMKQGYENWFRDVSATRGYAPPRVQIGTGHENPVILTRQDRRAPSAGEEVKRGGHWDVEIAEPGQYKVVLTFDRPWAESAAHLVLGAAKADAFFNSESKTCVFPSVRLDRGPARVEAWIERGDQAAGAGYIEIERLR